MNTTNDPNNPPTLADIVREETNDGLRILDFYIDALDGKLEGFTAVYRLEAALALLDMVVETPLLRMRWQDSALGIVLASNLDLFRKVVRFQVDVVEGGWEDFTVRRRVLLAEQLRNCLALVDSVDAGGKFSKIFREETDAGARIDGFLSDVVHGKVDCVTEADALSARELLDDPGCQEDHAHCVSPGCCGDWKASALDPDYAFDPDDSHVPGCGCTEPD